MSEAVDRAFRLQKEGKWPGFSEGKRRGQPPTPNSAILSGGKKGRGEPIAAERKRRRKFYYRIIPFETAQFLEGEGKQPHQKGPESARSLSGRPVPRKKRGKRDRAIRRGKKVDHPYLIR